MVPPLETADALALEDDPLEGIRPAFLSIARPPPPPGVSEEVWGVMTAMASALEQCAEGYWSAEHDTLIALRTFCTWERQAFASALKTSRKAVTRS